MSEDHPVDGPDGRGTPQAPPLGDLMPWSVPPLRLGRGWVHAPDAASLRRRWSALTRAADGAERAGLFGPTRARTLHSAVAPLPGRPAPGVRIGRETGPCPEPVRILHGPYDQQWLIPDSRLIDVPRTELWRVTGGRQIHLVQTPAPRGGSPAITFTTLVPDGCSPAGRPGRIRPLHRRPDGTDPNLAPGLLDLLSKHLGLDTGAEDFLAWTAAAAQADPGGTVRVPLTVDPAVWQRGVALGRRSLWLHTRGAYGGDGSAPRLPGGRRPYVRATLPSRPGPAALAHDAEENALLVGEGRIAPVTGEAWRREAAGTGVLEQWFAERAGADGAGPGTLAALRPSAWPQEWTSELLELITVLTLLAELEPELRRMRKDLHDGPLLGTRELHEEGMLPPPPTARRPATVLELSEEGPDGQLTLL